MRDIFIFFFAGIFFIAGCSHAASNDAPKDIRHIIVIGVDGMSPDGIRNAATPIMHQMINDGAIKWDVRTVLPSSSSPNWASMISGAGPEQHGVTDNDWERDEHSLPPVIMDDDGIFPTIFEVIRKNRPDAKIGAIYNWEGFGRLIEKGAVNYDTTASVDSTILLASSFIEKEKPLFCFIQLDNVDAAGHKYGHGSNEYYRAVAKADTLIGNILKSIRNAAIDKNTLVIVTADHGGKGYGHGGATPEEAEIAMIFNGKDVKPGYSIEQPVYTYDLAATIAFCLGIEPPYAWIGRPVKSAFEGFSEPSNLWKGKKLIAAPVIYPKPHLYAEAGGLYTDTTALVKMEPVADKSVIRYTLDGSEPDSNSAIYKAEFTLDTTAVVKAKSFDKNGNESLTSSAFFRVVKKEPGMGLQTDFYRGKNWVSIPDFSKLTPFKSWVSPEFQLNREQLFPLLDNDIFGVVFKGYIEINKPGKYTFYTKSDDGSNLYIDAKKVVDNDGSHGVIRKSGDMDLTAGRHAIRIDYFNSLGGFWLDVFYKGPGVPRQIIPANKLFLKGQ